jgi:anti-sigma B factor antagonist
MAVDGQSTFDIQTVVRPDRHTLVLSGDLNAESAAKLEPFVAQVCAEGAGALVLDITRLSFIDSSGLGAILRAQTFCREHGTVLTMTPGKRAVQRVFEITGLTDELPFNPVA